MADNIVGAAQSLVKNLNSIAREAVGEDFAPLTYGVYIHNNPETQKQSIRISVRPGYPLEVPKEFMGYPIEEVIWVDWPKRL